LLSNVISGSTKVIDFGTNRKRIFDFLLLINSNLCRISHRFGDAAAYWSKIDNSYPPHPHSTPSLVVTPSNFETNVISPETRMMGLPYGEEIMIVGRTMWTQCTSVTDGRTDRITITKTVQRIASHGKKCARILILESGQYNLRECPLLESRDARQCEKNLVAVMIVSPRPPNNFWGLKTRLRTWW